MKPYIDRTYPVEKVKEAIAYIIKEHTQGKVVLEMTFKEEQK